MILKASALALLLVLSSLGSVAPSSAASPRIDPACREHVSKARSELTPERRALALERCADATARVNRGLDGRGVYRCVVRFGDERRSCLDRARELRQRALDRTPAERDLYRDCVDLAMTHLDRARAPMAQDRCDVRARRVANEQEPRRVFGCVFTRGDYGSCVEDRTEDWAAARQAAARAEQRAREQAQRAFERARETQDSLRQRNQVDNDIARTENRTGRNCYSSNPFGNSPYYISCF